jgi:hypothetical protein
MKLQLMIEYKSGKYESIVTTDGVASDQRYMGQVLKQIGINELLIYDLGYSKQEYMIGISQRESYFASRFNHQVNLYKSVIDDMTGENVLGENVFKRFDLEMELRKLAVSNVSLHEFELWISNSGKVLKIRLIVESVPKSIVEQRMKKAKRKAGKKKRKPTPKYLYLQNWNLYITNIEQEKIVAKDIILLYKIRWQIEIVFKSWKSYHGLEHVKGKRKSRIECFIYGRLIMIVIMCFLFNTIHRNVWDAKLAEQRGSQPNASISQSCEDSASTKAAYRFYENSTISAQAILSSHIKTTQTRMSQESIVLAVQDTTQLDYSSHPATQGLGTLQTKNQHGLIMHTTLAVTPSRVPLGVIHHQVWSRPEEEFGKKHQRKKRPIEE